MKLTIHDIDERAVTRAVAQANEDLIRDGKDRLILEGKEESPQGFPPRYWVRSADENDAGYRIAYFASNGMGMATSRGDLTIETGLAGEQSRALVDALNRPTPTRR